MTPDSKRAPTMTPYTRDMTKRAPTMTLMDASPLLYTTLMLYSVYKSALYITIDSPDRVLLYQCAVYTTVSRESIRVLALPSGSPLIYSTHSYNIRVLAVAQCTDTHESCQ